MVGQEKLLSKLNTYTIDTFPRTCMFVAEKGCGKHLVADYAAKNVIKLPLIDITEQISDEYINAIYRNPNPAIYLIDMSKLNEKVENSILKFIEEPGNNTFIILLTENTNLLLNTIMNRCVVFNLDRYSKNELLEFIPDTFNEESKNLILEILHSPGRIKNLNGKNLKDVYDLCEKLLTKVQLASYSNTLSVIQKINFKDEYDKIDFDLFFDMMIYVCTQLYVKTHDESFVSSYQLINDYKNKCVDTRFNREQIFRNFLTNFWQLKHRRGAQKDGY